MSGSFGFRLIVCVETLPRGGEEIDTVPGHLHGDEGKYGEEESVLSV